MLASAGTTFAYQANSKRTVALLGVGNRGQYVGKIFADDARVQVTALCDIDPLKIDQAKTKMPATSGARVFKDAGEMFAAGGFDAVYIATPVYLHPEHFEMAVKAGVHVYCEKPAGASVAGVKRLQSAARSMSAEKVCFFGFQQRWSPEYLEAEKILRAGRIGDLLLMRAEWMVGGVRFGAPVPTQEQAAKMWYPWRAKSGDFIVEQDCHGVDVLNWYAQSRPLSAVGAGGKGKRPIGDNLDHVNVTYYYPKGLPGYLHATQLAQAGRIVREQFFGTLGNIETQRGFYEVEYSGQKPQRVPSKREITIDAVELFLSHIEQGKRTNMAQDACDSTFTSLLGRIAVDSKREVTWEEMLRSE
jgi:predicted dehydrogenase